MTYRFTTIVTATDSIDRTDHHWVRDNWTGDVWERVYLYNKRLIKEEFDYNAIKLFENILDRIDSGRLDAEWANYRIGKQREADAWVRRDALTYIWLGAVLINTTWLVIATIKQRKSQL